MKLPRIAVVDDEPHICEVIRLYLVHSDFEPMIYHRAQAALEGIRRHPPDLLLLDVMLPDQSGFELCREIRKDGSAAAELPIILLTAKGESSDKLQGFHFGADDYIVKPFDPNELIARIRAVLRRSAVRGSSSAAGTPPETVEKYRSLEFEGLTVDLERYKVTVDGRRVELTPKEIELLYFMASRPNRVFSRDDLLEHVWNFDFTGGTRTVDAHVKNLRKKLPEQKGWRIQTLWGVGYAFEVAADE